jgi:hypothetical protein
MIEEYDSKPIIIKTGDGEYKLCWNVGNVILSILTEKQMLDLRDAIDKMTALPPGQRDVYRFPIMRHGIMEGASEWPGDSWIPKELELSE